jgi:adenylate cyclase
LALSQYTARDYSAAAETATKVVALKPDYPYGHWHLAGSCAQLGQMDRARAALGELLRLLPGLDSEFVVSVAPYRNSADLEHLIDGLRKAGWEG